MKGLNIHFRHNLTETFVDNLSLGLAKSLEKLPGVQVSNIYHTNVYMVIQVFLQISELLLITMVKSLNKNVFLSNVQRVNISGCTNGNDATLQHVGSDMCNV